MWLAPIIRALFDAGFFTGGLVGAGADFRRRPEFVFDDRFVDVFFLHRHRFEQNRGHFFDFVVFFGVDETRWDLFAFGQRDGHFGSVVSLWRDRLVDGHELFADENPLDRFQFGILAGGRLAFLFYTR